VEEPDILGRPEGRTLQEVATVGLMVLATLLALGGVMAAVVPDVGIGDIGRAALAVGLFVLVAAVGISIPLGTLRRLRADTTGGRAYDLLRGQRRLRVAAMLLQFLEIASAVVLIILVSSTLGLVRIDIAPRIVGSGILVLAGALALACLAALSQALQTPIRRDRTIISNALGGIGLSLAVLAALGAVLALVGQMPAIGLSLGPGDAGTFALAGYLGVAFAMVRLRSLPTLTAIIWADRGDRSRAEPGKGASAVLVPAILAFALLLVVFLLFLLFGIGASDLFVNVGHNPLLLGVMGFLLVALLSSLGIAFRLARTTKGDEALYRELPDAERRRRQTIIVSSGVVAGSLIVGAAASFIGLLPHPLWLHLFCFGLLIALGPYGFYAAREHNRIRRLEQRFPDFLRDIASSHKGGLTLHQAAAIAARGEYGDLTPEVRKMADQLSWNVSFSEALERFAERVQTPLVQRAVSLILQADRSGGSTTDVLLAAARDAREIKNLENERRLTMGLYTVVVYITFFVFLGVAAILYAQFAPQIVASQTAVAGLGTGSSQGLAGVSGNALKLDQYQLFYFMAAVVQGLGDGMVAGLLGTGKAVLGLRHSFVMVAISYVIFAVLL
jgi:flagellar protein FlaJ